MKRIEDGFAARLSSGVTGTCLCWRLERPDGSVLAVTDHDKELTVAGVTYAPGAAFDPGSFGHSAAMMPAQASGSGALSHDGLSEADLAAGVWDGTRIDIVRAEWRAPFGHIHVWSGWISEIRRGAAGFEADLVSLKAGLERPVGRVFARACDAALGDDRCGVVIEGASGLTCDHRFETCRDVFSNAQNFRGFPHMPGTDVLLLGPAPSGNDGGRR